MKHFFTYHSFLKGIIFVLLIGQFWANTVSHCHWMIDSESELIELCSSEDSETEEEIEKKEKNKKIDINITALQSNILIFAAIFSQLEDFKSVHYLENTTPPPEHFFS